MRLTCPNCDARYEVPDEVVPKAGRDVQCSNCGQTWFQYHPDHMPQDADGDTLSETEGGVPAPDDFAEDEETAPPPPPPGPQPKRRELDPAVADILRQEAEAEQEARRRRQQNAEALESQPDLGLDDTDGARAPAPAQEFDAPETDEAAEAPAEVEPEIIVEQGDDHDRRTQEARKRMARMRGEPEPSGDAEAQAAALSSRRQLLPDIDEINSTLRTDKDRNSAEIDAQDDTLPVPRRSSGFRTGFLLMVLIAVIGALIYLYAPQIARSLPQADPYLSSYVAWVDDGRMWLDAQIRSLLEWLDMMAVKSSG